jgi:hypothetical protein
MRSKLTARQELIVMLALFLAFIVLYFDERIGPLIVLGIGALTFLIYCLLLPGSFYSFLSKQNFLSKDEASVFLARANYLIAESDQNLEDSPMAIMDSEPRGTLTFLTYALPFFGFIGGFILIGFWLTQLGVFNQVPLLAGVWPFLVAIGYKSIYVFWKDMLPLHRSGTKVALKSLYEEVQSKQRK